MPQPIVKSELPIVQKIYDFIKWYIPILNRLTRDHKFGLGDRMPSFSIITPGPPF